jgi:hypothetical protein
MFGNRAALTLDRREDLNSMILTVPQNGDAHTGIPG